MNIQLDPHVKAVFDDIVAHTPDIGPAPSDDTVNLGPAPTNNSRRWLAVAAAAIVVVGMGALVAVQRSSSDAPDAAPATQPPASVDLAPGGAVVFDQTPPALQDARVSAGNRFEPATSGELAGATEVPTHVRRWYTSNAVQPERAAWVAVDSFPAAQVAPHVPPDAEAVTAQGVDARVYDAPVMTGRSIAFTVGDTTYVLTADHLADNDLVRAADHVRAAADGYGAVIDSAGLTNGLTERAAGTMIESFFISRQALEHPIPQTHWQGPDESMWVSALTEDPTMLPLHRLGYTTVTDTSVHDLPAFVTTLGEFQPEYRGVTWSENGITYLLGSNNFDDDTIVEYANLLRPATSSEWNDLVAAHPAQGATDSPVPTTAPTTASAATAIDRLEDTGGRLPRFALSEVGWTMTHASESDLGGSYSFEHPDGRILDVNTIAGGEDAFAVRVGGENRVVLGRWYVLDYAATPGQGGDVGRYRADSLRGEWTYEFDGAPFDSIDAFMATVAGAHTVDETEWEDSLPVGFVSGSDQAATVNELLQDVPLPDGFDIESLSDGTTNSRYQFIARVSGAVACAWLDQWFTGQETDDSTMQQDAATALATSHEWAMLIEIADQGGWSDEVWRHADAVNGGEGVMTGAGPQPPSREEANSALGCEI